MEDALVAVAGGRYEIADYPSQRVLLVPSAVARGNGRDQVEAVGSGRAGQAPLVFGEEAPEGLALVLVIVTDRRNPKWR